MTKNWIALNIVLLMIAGSLGWQLYLGIDRFNAQNDVAKIVPIRDLKQTGAQGDGLAPMAQVRRINASEFSIIPEKNVFSPARTREAKTDVAAISEIPPLTQKPILIGVTIVGGQRMASIIDPVRQASGNRKSQIKKPGDMYQGYTITDITEEQIVLEAGTRKEIIPLHMGTKRSAQAGKTPVLATRVVSIGPSAASGGTMVQAAASLSGGVARSSGGSTAQTSSASSTRGARTSAASPTAASQAAEPSSQSGARSVSSSTQTVAPASGTQTGRGTSSTGSQGQKVIRTPFGNITRPDTE